MSSNVASNTGITLKGSVEIVAEYFDYALNNILFQRGVYPEESFTMEHRHGLSLLMTTKKDLKEYIAAVLKQAREWLRDKKLRKLVIVISDLKKNQPLEKWEFDIQCEKDVAENEIVDKDEKVIRKEIMSVIRQITASVSFLPFLDSDCSFNLKFYTDKDTECPLKFEDTPPCYLENAEHVKLQSISTGIHQIHTAVQYQQPY